MFMVQAYNFYLGGYLPKLSPKSSIHNKSELKSKYKSIVSMNNANPLVMVRLSNDMQAYALNVKEMSMELQEATTDALAGGVEEAPQNMERVADIFNGLLKRSDEFGIANGKPSRPGGELRSLIENYREELQESGIAVDNESFLSISKDAKAVQVPEEFTKALATKAEQMSMNPMEYVEKKVYSYAHLYRNNVGNSYESSVYSGMLFNSYC